MMERKDILLNGDLTADNAQEVFGFFLDNTDRLVCCMTSRKDVTGEPILHFVGFCKEIKVSCNEGERKRFIIELFYSLNKEAPYWDETFSSFGNVLHWNHIHKIAYVMEDSKLIIKYFCRGSKIPASFLVLQTL